MNMPPLTNKALLSINQPSLISKKNEWFCFCSWAHAKRRNCGMISPFLHFLLFFFFFGEKVGEGMVEYLNRSDLGLGMHRFMATSGGNGAPPPNSPSIFFSMCFGWIKKQQISIDQYWCGTNNCCFVPLNTGQYWVIQTLLPGPANNQLPHLIFTLILHFRDGNWIKLDIWIGSYMNRIGKVSTCYIKQVVL